MFYFTISLECNNSKCDASVHLLKQRSVAHRQLYISSHKKRASDNKYAPPEYNPIEKVMISVTRSSCTLPLYHLLTILKPASLYPPFSLPETDGLRKRCQMKIGLQPR